MAEEPVRWLAAILGSSFTFHNVSTGPSSELPMPKTVATKPYDWTYTTVYAGHQMSSNPILWQLADLDNPSHTIPLAELTRQDPILFYAEIPLYEDELHDNGSSHILVRIVSLSCAFCFHARSPRVVLARHADVLLHSLTFYAQSR